MKLGLWEISVYMCPDISHDLAIARVAYGQHGNIARAQLLAAGLDDHAIARRVRAGTLHRVYPGVYAVGRPPRVPLERAAAAVLACAPTGCLSHASAMTLWGFWKRWDTPFEVTVTKDRRPRGIKVHRPTTLARRDIRTQLGIRVTSPARALLDIAPRLTEHQRRRAVKEALVSRWLKQDHLAELMHRLPLHPGTKLLTLFVATPTGLTRSELEDAFLAFCERFGLPRPLTNVIVAGYLVDAYFPDHKLIVEIDSHDFHLNPVSFETDRDRDADTLLAGIATVRVTHERMTATPRKEADRLMAILEQRHHSGSGPGPGSGSVGAVALGA